MTEIVPLWKCPDCGLQLRDVVLPVRHKCRPAAPQAPGLLRRATNLAIATAKHVANRGRRRTAEEQQAILDQHCSGCPFFDGRICRHKDCGCPVTAEDRFLSKLAWESEHCPDKPPQW